MAINFKKYITSGRAKKSYLFFAALLLIFFLINDILMPWYVDNEGVLSVPSVVGSEYEEARKMLDSLGFETRKGDVRLDRAHRAGIVIIQNPQEGAIVKKGRRVYLTVSGGEVMVEVPNIKGRTMRDARFQLEREGLRLGAVEYEYSDEFPENTVIEQKVTPGTKVKRDVYVSVVVSQGTETDTTPVPDITGRQLTEAIKILTSLGFVVGTVTTIPSSDLLPNTVVDQYPRGGENASRGGTIDLIVIEGGEQKKEIFEN